MKSPHKNKTTLIKSSWIHHTTKGEGPRYKQIVRMICAAVSRGELLPGDKLPTQRELAELIGVDLTTVTRAYNEVREKGVLQATTGRGSFIAYAPDVLPHVDLSMNTPPGTERILPLITSTITRLQQLTDVEMLMTYHVGAGSPGERAAAVQWLKPVMGEFSAERVVVCPGAQTAISVLLMLLSSPGEVIITDTLTYPGFIAAARLYGRRVVSVEADDEGICPDKLIAACRQHQAKVIYLNPTIHNPTAITMSPARRQTIATLLTENQLTLIEDDPYSLLPDSVVQPIAAYAPRNSWYISTISKCLSPGMRIAWIIAPENTASEAVVHALRSNILVANPLMLAVVTDWINTGTAQDLLQELRRENQQRQLLARQIIKGSIQADPSGLHLWLKHSEFLDTQALTLSASQAGLGITPSHVFSPTGAGTSGIRVSLGGARSIEQLSDALNRLNSVLSSNATGIINGIV